MERENFKLDSRLISIAYNINVLRHEIETCIKAYEGTGTPRATEINIRLKVILDCLVDASIQMGNQMGNQIVDDIRRDVDEEYKDNINNEKP